MSSGLQPLRMGGNQKAGTRGLGKPLGEQEIYKTRQFSLYGILSNDQKAGQ